VHSSDKNTQSFVINTSIVSLSHFAGSDALPAFLFFEQSLQST